MKTLERKPGEIVFGQWKVDANGNIEDTLSYEYRISADRLNEPDWEEHMSQKSWVNILDFVSALNYAKKVVAKSDEIKDLEALYGELGEPKTIEQGLSDIAHSLNHLGEAIITAALIQSNDPKLAGEGWNRYVDQH